MLYVFFKWGIACLKRSFILLGPMFFMGMFLLDILTQAHFDYPNVPSIEWLKWMAGVFYLICLWILIVPFRKIQWVLLFFVGGAIIAFVLLNADLKKIYQHSKCLEDSSYSCPDVFLSTTSKAQLSVS